MTYFICVCLSILFMTWFVPWAAERWTNKKPKTKSKIIEKHQEMLTDEFTTSEEARTFMNQNSSTGDYMGVESAYNN